MFLDQVAKLDIEITLDDNTTVFCSAVMEMYDAVHRCDGFIEAAIAEEIEYFKYNFEDVKSWKIIGGYIGTDTDDIQVEITRDKVGAFTDNVLDFICDLHKDLDFSPTYEALIAYLDNFHNDFKIYDSRKMLESFIGIYKNDFRFSSALASDGVISYEDITDEFDNSDLRHDIDRFEVPMNGGEIWYAYFYSV